MIFGVFEHIVVVTLITIILARNTRYFYPCVILTLIVILGAFKYLKEEPIIIETKCESFAEKTWYNLKDFYASVVKHAIN